VRARLTPVLVGKEAGFGALRANEPRKMVDVWKGSMPFRAADRRDQFLLTPSGGISPMRFVVIGPSLTPAHGPC
jgi:hypothetical protein